MKKYTLRSIYTPINFPENAIWQRHSIEPVGNKWVLTLKNLTSDSTDDNFFYLEQNTQHEVEEAFKDCFIQVS